jgi:hypothetical protein
VTIVDVQCTILVVLGQFSGVVPGCLAEGVLAAADLDCDSSVTVGDVVSVININLGVPLDPQVDTNADGCPDSCPLAVGCAGE